MPVPDSADLQPEQLGFTQSHSIVNYEWIFILPKNKGDVKARN
jgi:hypothetical protein